MKLLREKGVRTVVVPPETNHLVHECLHHHGFRSFFCWEFGSFFMRQMQSGGGKALSFGKSKARLMGDKKKSDHL